MITRHWWSPFATGLLVVAGLSVAASGVEAQQDLSTYGYFSWRYEKVFNEPGFEGGQIVNSTAPREFSTPFFNLMFQHQIAPRFTAFVNLSGASGAMDVRNLWGEYAFSQKVNVRLGKVYRKFGLYNEILDAVPTYYGIEPPEMFDSDHYLISRTTSAMVYGGFPAGDGTLNYSVSTDNGEGADIFEGAFPLGWDVNYKFGGRSYTLGFSGYTSGGQTNSDVGVGEGSPKAGVLPWMAADSFNVLNGYAEARVKGLTLQVEYARANHEAERDADAVLQILANTDLNSSQMARFLVDPNGSTTDPANVSTVGDYTVQTWYFRAGYSVDTRKGEVGPYVQWDWYENPETIASKKWGGDNEAGVADDGTFSKGTMGVLFRPIPQVAVKLDGSAHFYTFHGEKVSYPEIRFDVSYTFGF